PLWSPVWSWPSPLRTAPSPESSVHFDESERQACTAWGLSLPRPASRLVNPSVTPASSRPSPLRTEQLAEFFLHAATAAELLVPIPPDNPSAICPMPSNPTKI